MTSKKNQRVHEFKIRVIFNKAVSATVAKKEIRASLVGHRDWCFDECHADELVVTSISSMPTTREQT